MTSPGRLAHLLRNVTTRELIGGLERDGFRHSRGKGSHRVYRHQDGRRTTVDYHRGGATIPLRTLRQIMRDTDWTEGDARRLGLI